MLIGPEVSGIARLERLTLYSLVIVGTDACGRSETEGDAASVKPAGLETVRGTLPVGRGLVGSISNCNFSLLITDEVCWRRLNGNTGTCGGGTRHDRSRSLS